MLALCCRRPLRAQIIDRVLAVVVGEPITLSDVTAAMRLGLVPAPAGSEDRVQAVLKALIERQLQLDRSQSLRAARTVRRPRSRPGWPRCARRFDSQAALESGDAGNGRVSRRSCARAFATMCGIETYLQQRFGGVLPA